MFAEAPINSGISNFAARIKQAVVDGMDMARKVELERVELEKQLAEKSVIVKEAQERAVYQLVEGRLSTLEDIRRITEAFGLRERLEYINTTVWEGKGQIRDISTPREAASYINQVDWPDDWSPRVGFELVYPYQSAVEERVNASKGRSSGYNWRFVPGVENTYLKMFVKSFDGSGARIGSLSPHVEKGRVLDVSSPYIKAGKIEVGLGNEGKYNLGDGYMPFVNYVGRPLGYAALFEDYARFRLEPPNYEGIEEKLDQVLVNESTVRTREGAIPSKLILAGQEKLRRAKASPQWKKWEYVELYYDSGD